MLALRLRRRGVIDEKRCDETCERADMSAPRFPESLSDLVASYQRASEEHRAIMREGKERGFSDWLAALAEASAQAEESERAAIAAYCARYGLTSPIEAYHA